MKSRIFVVDDKFMENINKNLEIEVFVPYPNDKQWYKTITDIISDVFQLKINDYIFFWQEKKTNPDSYIWGVYRVVSNPFFSDNYFKIKIERAYDFENPVTEYDILNDPYNKIDLWNICGKKISGKPRASTPLSPYETEYLIQKLIGANKNYNFFPSSNKLIKVKNEITINFKNKYKNKTLTNLSDLDINKISFFNEDGSLQYEKFLELLFNYQIHNNNNEILSQLNINIDEIYWYANYLPYSLTRNEIDYLIMESKDNVAVNKIDLIEFKKDTLDIDHINRCLIYTKWINSKLARGNNITRPILICTKHKNISKDLKDQIKDLELKYRTQPLEIYILNCYDEKFSIIKEEI